MADICLTCPSRYSYVADAMALITEKIDLGMISLSFSLYLM